MNVEKLPFRKSPLLSSITTVNAEHKPNRVCLEVGQSTMQGAIILAQNQANSKFNSYSVEYVITEVVPLFRYGYYFILFDKITQ